MDLLRVQVLPEDIIHHIGRFYITKQMKLQCRLDKIYNKVKELEKRTIDEWIEHLKFSKRYRFKDIEIINDVLHFHNMWGDKCKCNKNDIIDQGCIMHVRKLYRMYIDRIINASTPTPQYVGEKFTNIVGKQLTSKIKENRDYPYHTCLVFTE